MGSITFQVVGDASVGTRTKTFAVSDENINRLVAYAKGEGADLTTPQALLKWAELMMALTKDRIIAHERAAQAIPPIEAV